MQTQPVQQLVIVNFILLFLIGFGFESCQSVDQKIPAQFVGRETCVECHQKENELFMGSDHDHAMDTAIVSTVLGDFNDTEFEWNGFVNRFFIHEDKYYVHTQGPGGIAWDFQISYVFGVRPLQQYLIPFENGRLQCLPIAWDTEEKRWYHLADSVYADQDIQPNDWLYWTNNGQNWNGMCAECHSTNLQKNFNPETRVYQTSWSEIDVSCEACHGPSSEHNKWAELPESDRPVDNNFGLVVQTSNISSRQAVDQCAYCHARRSSFGDFVQPHENVYNIISPQLPVAPYYFSDGQILEEDYVYASFTQSKMHMNKVRCANCHDVHSLKLKKEGNDLCAQCHEPAKYDIYEHHFHKTFNEIGEALVLEGGKKIVEVGEGAQCVNCHMPGRYFMGVDYRRDHGMRIPRPDLSNELGTPNSCTQCHTDKDNQWAASFTKKWYPEPDKRPHFGKDFFLAEHGDTAAIIGLLEIVKSDLSSPLITAAATRYLAAFEQEKATQLCREMLQHPEAVVRKEAVSGFRAQNIDDLIQTLAPMLFDSTKMVRLEVISLLSAVPLSEFDTVQQRAFNNAVAEYIEAMNYSADFSGSRHNLGNIYANLGQLDRAETNYKEAIRIDEQFFPAIINLAMLYNKMGKNDKAEILLRHVVKEHPEYGEAYYSLGLLLAEMQNYDDALLFLEQAAERLPNRARVFYNLYQMQLFKKQLKKAEITLKRCLELDAENLDYNYAAIEFYIKSDQTAKAKYFAQQILTFYPNLPEKQELESFIINMQ